MQELTRADERSLWCDPDDGTGGIEPFIDTALSARFPGKEADLADTEDLIL
jgi:hypothetical protein